MNPVPHGGDPEAVAAAYGVDARDVLDFSANIDPFGPPLAVAAFLTRAIGADARVLAAYPRAGLPRLTARLAAEHAVDPACIVVGNGTAALLDAVARALACESGTGPCIVPLPAFGEYARAFTLAGVSIATRSITADGRYALDARALVDAAGRLAARVLVLTNPHNPTGGVVPAAILRGLQANLAARGTALVLDEAFIDYVPEHSLARDAATTRGLVVLRSLTKFYATAGLRVGYLVTNPGLAARIRAYVPAWPVGTLAAAAAEIALDDTAYRERTRQRNATARDRLAASFATIGFASQPAAANFLMLRVPKGCADLPERLVRDFRIVVRDCTSFGGLAPGAFVRVGVRSEAENLRLVDACAAAASASVAASARSCASHRETGAA